jgi:SAM-dependent methyltransferase
MISRSVWEAIRLIPPGASRILDIGCHVGYLGQIVKAGRPVEVVGVELDAGAAQRARRHLDRVIVEDIEQAESLPFPDRSFDCITMLDVVEHLIAPDRVLGKIRRYLRPGGCIICSIPNVRHISVLGSLLLPGRRWTIEGQGMVTDPPHLRFLTLEDILKLLQDAGFAITAPIQASCSDPEDPFLADLGDHLRGLRGTSPAHLERLRMEFSIFQFIFRAGLGADVRGESALQVNRVPNSLHPLRELIQAMSANRPSR